MAGKTTQMNQVKQIFLMHKNGESKKQIARNLGISKNTVKAYLSKLTSLKQSTEELILKEEPLLKSVLHAGQPSYKNNELYEAFKGQIDYFVNELKKEGVTRHLLWEEYRLTNPSGYGYTQFCHHLRQHQQAQRPSMVLTHLAGEKLYIDFAGAKLSYINKETGEVIWCPVFVACLPYSDYCYVQAVRSQNTEEFIHALSSCLEFLGGVPKSLVPDNLKSAIIKANNYEPDVNNVLIDFCNYYETTVIPARVRKPKDKALVENQVKIIYTRVYAKLRHITFFSLAQLNTEIKEKVLLHNQTRMQQKPYCREEKFLSDEKHLLLPLPTSSFEIKYYRAYKVGQNNHIYLTQDKHYYSVPYRWTGAQSKVIYTRSMVRIFVSNELVAVHQRSYAPSGYTTVTDHLCSHHKHYLQRSPDYYRSKALEKSKVLFSLIDKLFKGGRLPEQNYRSCDGLFSLHKRTDPDTFNQACEIAIEYGICSYKFVLKTIENLKKMSKQEPLPRCIPLPEHTNLRGKEYYKQSTINFNQNESN